jgi:putative membrane protein
MQNKRGILSGGSEMTNEKAVISEKKEDASKHATDMAAARTAMASDRSMMAWLRTGLSLITFGFTVYKFLEYSNEQIFASGRTLDNVASPELIGLFMIGMGILSLLLGIIENLAIRIGLKEQFEIKHPRYALLMSLIILIF